MNSVFDSVVYHCVQHTGRGGKAGDVHLLVLVAQAGAHELPCGILFSARARDGKAEVGAEHAAVSRLVRHADKGVGPAVIVTDRRDPYQVLQQLELQQAVVQRCRIASKLGSSRGTFLEQAYVILVVKAACPGL